MQHLCLYSSYSLKLVWPFASSISLRGNIYSDGMTDSSDVQVRCQTWNIVVEKNKQPPEMKL